MVMQRWHIAENCSTEVTNPQRAHSSPQWTKVRPRFEHRASIPKHMWSRVKLLLAGVSFKDGSILEADKKVIGFQVCSSQSEDKDALAKLENRLPVCMT